MAYNKKGYIIRAKAIAKIVNEHYEQGNQSKCLKSVWRHHIYPQWGMCYRTFLRYVKTIHSTEVKKAF
ncbi:MAG: hypothetical protein CVU12_01980 [Bacteroidetes bacterium HGW-Bacteroidetes-7]|nr:MAG: hypothetical protein CVU12_01980 [Bacteroidetes bacterium HGW-Bacteroidetes-7]